MIPKTIHYCWFGRNPKPQKVLDYIDTWKKFLPDFEIKEWNEDNFDVNMLPYTKEAYFAKKYAFVSDVARLYALVYEGGVYFDTDIRVVKRFSDELLNSHGFLGFEHDVLITTGVMASEAECPILKTFLEEYRNRFFFKKLKFDTTTNVAYITDLMRKKGASLNNTQQIIDNMIILPQVYLCANDCRTHKIYANSETYAIHEFSYTWGETSRVRKRLKQAYTILKYMLTSK